MKVRIQNGIATWQGETIPSRIAERPEIRNYHLRVDLHEVDGFADAQFMDVPAGFALVNEAWSVGNGVAVQSGTLRAVSEIEAAAAAAAAVAEVSVYVARMAELAPIFETHPDPADIVPGGMLYRVPDPDNPAILTWWLVRDNDLVAQQLSSHDAAGNPINRSVNLKTRVCTTFLLGEIVNGLKNAAAVGKAKKETTVAAAKPKKEKGHNA